MDNDSESEIAARFALAGRIMAGLVAAIGAAVIVGWLFGIGVLKSLHPSWITMKANTAICFALGAAALLLLTPGVVSEQRRRIGFGLAALVLLTGAATLAEHLLGLDLRIDQLLILDDPGAVLTPHPGRMAPNSAFCFALIGGAVLLLDSAGKYGLRLAQAFAVLAGCLSLLPFLGYVFSASTLAGVGHSARMAVHTALSFMFLSCALLCARPSQGFMAVVTDAGEGGRTARNLLPVAGLLPLLLVGALQALNRRGALEASYIAPLTCFLMTLVLGWFFLWRSRKVAKAEAVVKAANQQLRAGEQQLKAANQQLKATEQQLRGVNQQMAGTQSELLQAQKMESVGRLAGGVAHDFNNLLTAIKGYAGFVKEGLPQGDAKREDIDEVLGAAERAASLTRQLLAFSRKQVLDPKILDVNNVVSSSVKMLKCLVGEDLIHETRLAPYPCMVKGDAGQIDQVLINLVVNARDAMPKGGTVRVSTEVVVMPDDFFKGRKGLEPGPLVLLRVSDTGIGMSDDVRAHLFEPFFTTKELGKGTGLGLSTVYGIIKQSGGDIEVESAPGHGTMFRIYLPRVDIAPKDKEKDEDKSAPSRGTETILLIEDEDVLRRLGERALAASGYKVLAAANGLEARKVMERHGRPVDLVVTDVVMPGMSGREIARELSDKRMSGRTLYISGYTDDSIVKHGVLEPGLSFLYKPFSPQVLLREIREVLDGPADQAQA